MKNLFFAIAFISLVTFGFRINAEDDVKDNTVVPANNNAPGFNNVTENDIVFFRLESYDLTKVNLPIYPYFEVYEWNGNQRGKRVCQTSAKEKFAITQKVEKPWKYYISIPNVAGKNYVFCVFSDYKNIEAVPGIPVSSNIFMNWKDTSKTNVLQISPDNTIVLRFVKENKKYLYFQIESFQITKVSDSYLENLKNDFQMKVRFSHNPEKGKEYNIGSSRLRNIDLRIEDIPVDFEFKTDYRIEFYNKMGTFATFSFNSKELFDNLKKGNEEYLLKNGNVQCKLLFNGIRRIYRVKTIIIPETAPIRAKQRPLLASEDPRLLLWVQEDGRYCGITRDYATPGIRKAWSVDFPDEVGNRFMIREGKNHSYSIHVEDKAPWFDSPMIAEFVPLTDQSFKNGEIVQNLGPMVANQRAIKVIVEEVKMK